MTQREDATKTIQSISSDRPSTVIESDLRMRLRTFPRDAQTWYTLGSYLHSSGRLDEAEEALRKAISLNPGPAHFLEELARILMDLGRLDEAYQLYDKRAPSSIDALRGEIGVLRRMEAAAEENTIAISPCIDCSNYTYYGCSKDGACDSIIRWRTRISQLAIQRSPDGHSK
jgi:tetratricopeptide (TPR) repeat protein